LQKKAFYENGPFFASGVAHQGADPLQAQSQSQPQDQNGKKSKKKKSLLLQDGSKNQDQLPILE